MFVIASVTAVDSLYLGYMMRHVSMPPRTGAIAKRGMNWKKFRELRGVSINPGLLA